MATEWQQVTPLLWRFKLRAGVKFHDGAPFGADDVVFSARSAAERTSQIAPYVLPLGEVVKADDLTVEFCLKAVNPVFLQRLDTLFIMNKAWCELHKVTKPLDYKNKEETWASTHANGTGPFVLISRAPDIKTTHQRFAGWWGKADGNVQDIVYTPIANDATRLASR